MRKSRKKEKRKEFIAVCPATVDRDRPANFLRVRAADLSVLHVHEVHCIEAVSESSDRRLTFTFTAHIFRDVPLQNVRQSTCWLDDRNVHCIE